MPTRRQTLLAAAVLVFASCTSLDAPGNVNTLTVNLAIDKPTIFVNEVATITITVANFGSEAVTLTAPSGCLYYFDVRDVNGTHLYGSNDLCSGPTVTETIASGKEGTATFTWDGRSTAGPRLTSGTYLMRAGVTVSGKQILGGAAIIKVE